MPDLPRRPVLHALGGAVVGSLVAGTAGAAASPASAEPGRLSPTELTRRADGRWRSRPIVVPAGALVAFTWHGAIHTPRLAIRVRRDGRWGSARPVRRLCDLPDGDSEGRLGAAASQPLWLKGAEGIEVLLDHPRTARHLRVVVIDAGPQLGDRHPHSVQAAPASRAAVGSATTSARSATTTTPPAPHILDRRAWGADESLRSDPPRYNSTIQQVHVHHTDTDNGYSREDVPGIIRAIYRYHTQHLGWADIGYNFVVDRFGRLWEGRAGGMARPVRGAHTLGFNATSVGISMIGDYERVEPAAPALGGIVELAAWKLGIYGRRADADTTVSSEGSDLYAAGREVTLPTIDGHRDTNDTACPGSALYPHLPAIRTHTQALLDGHAAGAEQIVVTTPFELYGTPTPGRRLSVRAGRFAPADCTVRLAWSRGGVSAGTPDSDHYDVSLHDAGQTVSVVVTLEKSGYAHHSTTLATPLPVLAISRTAVTATTAGAQATVTVSVTSGAGVPTGSVLLVLGDQHRSVSLVDGSASAVFDAVPAGQLTLAADYRGDASVLASCATTSVTAAGGH